MRVKKMCSRNYYRYFFSQRGARSYLHVIAERGRLGTRRDLTRNTLRMAAELGPDPASFRACIRPGAWGAGNMATFSDTRAG